MGGAVDIVIIALVSFVVFLCNLSLINTDSLLLEYEQNIVDGIGMISRNK